MALHLRLSLAIAFAVAATLLPSSSSAQPAKPAVSELRVGILPIAPHTPVFAAQELGYFAQEGLKVDLQFGVGGAALLPLVIQGQMQLVNIPIATGLQARAQNIDVVMIGPGTYVEKQQAPGQTATIVKSDGKIRGLRDLAGKTVAVNVINSVNWLYNRALLAKAGVDVKTVTYVELPFPNMVDSVANGQVDAAAIVQPFLFFGTSSGKVRVVGYDFLDVQPGAQISGFATSRKWATANARTLAAFERATARAVDYLMANQKEAMQLVAKFTKAKPEIIEGAGVPSWSKSTLRSQHRDADAAHGEVRTAAEAAGRAQSHLVPLIGLGAVRQFEIDDGARCEHRHDLRDDRMMQRVIGIGVVISKRIEIDGHAVFPRVLIAARALMLADLPAADPRDLRRQLVEDTDDLFGIGARCDFPEEDVTDHDLHRSLFRAQNGQ